MPSRSHAESVERPAKPRHPDRSPSPDAGRHSPEGAAPSALNNQPLSDALASQQCAARVAEALRKMGYGFAVIPSTARPKRD